VNRIQLRQLDLNLLLIFRTLMEERSVQRAAEQIGRTPSAISHALGRLRQQIDDPLLVRVGGKMQPSPRALALYDEIAPMLHRIEQSLQPPQPFDPTTSERIFRVAGPTMNGLVTELVARMQAEAPHAGLEWVTPSPTMAADLVGEQIDVAWGNANSPLPDGIRAEAIAPIKRYVFGRRGHPGTNEWSLATWLSWPHAVVRIPTAIHGTVEEQLTSLGLKRRIGLHLTNWSGIAPALLRTNLLSNQPVLTFAECPDLDDFQVFLPPIPLPDLTFRVIWNARLDADPATRWIRRMLRTSLDALLHRLNAQLQASEIVQPRTTP
jgi:LysR family transcriptional activator of mexEF-oprN operon